MNADSDATSHPTLRSWLHGAPKSNPLVNSLGTSDQMLMRTHDAIEAILVDVERAAPQRLAGKRKELRGARDEPTILNTRTELAMAAKLYRAGIAFDFGQDGASSPDLHLRDRDLAIEVTAKTPAGVPHLYDELEVALAQTPGVSVHLRFSSFPIRMQPEDRMRLIEKVIPVAERAAATGTGGVVEIEFEDIRNPSSIIVAADVLPVPGLGKLGLPVTMESTGVELDPTMKALEQSVLAILEDPAKRKQGKATPSVLLVDLARLGGAWLRPPNVWAGSLAKLIPDDCPFLALAVTVVDLHQVDIPLGYALRSNTSAAQQLLVKSLFDDLNVAGGE